MNIIVHGSVAFDRIMDFPGSFKDHILPDKIHKLNVVFPIKRLDEKRGGTAGNIAYNLALLAEKPTIVAGVGKDGASYVEYLQNLGLSTEHIIQYEDSHTPCAFIMTDISNNQIAGFFGGATERPTNFSFAGHDPKESLVILSPANNREDTLRYAAECKQYGIPYIFDPGQTIPIFSGEDLRTLIDGSFMFTVNDYELQLVMNVTKLSEEEILSMTEILITTLGENGSIIKTAKKVFTIPRCQATEVKDPTGAGDAYRAGLMKAYLLGLSTEQMGRIATTCAVYAIEHHGTQEHQYSMDEFRKRYQENYEETCPL
ncbi:MAG TPA: carbohydrate kinase family protein [Patescibacteria group bacterium]|nr:carbohydrate kinase family protein [Patescibacteria group bacterium]